LLSRWLWRRAVAETLPDLSVNLSEPQELLAFIQAGEEQAVQALLSDIAPPSRTWVRGYLQSKHFNLDNPMSQLEANALLSLRPRHLLTGTPLDVASLIDEMGPSAFCPIVTRKSLPRPTLKTSILMRNMSNRLFHPPLPDKSLVEVLITPENAALEVLESHAIPPTGIALLRSGESGELLGQRMLALSDLTIRFLKARTRWDESDRPSLQSMIVDDEED
jgi:hypothetical protein